VGASGNWRRCAATAASACGATVAIWRARSPVSMRWPKAAASSSGTISSTSTDPISPRSQPALRLLALPVVDTLWLNPLAFPRHPYHHLVKHYQDGGLRRSQLNDPLLDAQLTLELFDDQYQALQQRQQRSARS
jgi:hypothetical protein